MKLLNTIVEYFRTAKSEMEKVSWPSRPDTIRYSSLVIGLSVTVALAFALLDAGLTKLVDVTIAARQQSVQSTPIQTEPVIPTTVPIQVETKDGTIDLKNVTPITTPTPTPAATQPDPTKK